GDRPPGVQERGPEGEASQALRQGTQRAERNLSLGRDVRAYRGDHAAREGPPPQRRFLLRVRVLRHGAGDRAVYADLRGKPDLGMDRPPARAVPRNPPDSPEGGVRRAGPPQDRIRGPRADLSGRGRPLRRLWRGGKPGA